MTLAEIADVVGGTVHAPDAGLVVDGEAYLDSRSPVPGGLFVAIVGERVDGHAYAAGSHAVLGSRPTEAPTVVVEDPTLALGLLARHLLDRIDATVVALTGSQGKTGTKDYLAGALAAVAGADAVVATAANNNNELGVPLTVLRAGPATRYVVVEMGARGVGHIAYLCRVAPPRVAAVINVGTAHIGEFGSREAIARAKGEIVESLPADGVAVLNADDDLTSAMASRTPARVLTFGRAGAVSWRDLALDDLGRPSFTLVLDPGPGGERLEEAVTLRQAGAHQVLNAAAATALAVGAGVPFGPFARALGDVAPASRWRMEVTERPDGLRVVNDAYNANPESMRAALEALVAMGAGGRRTVAVLGEMKELGSAHEEGHRSVGRAAADLGVDVLVVIGEPASGIAAGAASAAAPGADPGAEAGPEIVPMVGRDEAVTWLRQNARPEDVVLVKASRGAALEQVAAALMAAPDLEQILGQEGSTT
ncbi:UDP-N-acetylmuramoyl-tripeptide--D-alanyl-D-alanine ligase [Nocardioides sp. YIM 152588]|uniref:UDP-N-acetylmuramoyl-tripeptide--D-alanyl-D- alanine ligase n=1 Tax=Nocardioides sp. YIM 152588 TaxID=3158259 RepID=UPI0032E46F27